MLPHANVSRLLGTNCACSFLLNVPNAIHGNKVRVIQNNNNLLSMSISGMLIVLLHYHSPAAISAGHNSIFPA